MCLKNHKTRGTESVPLLFSESQKKSEKLAELILELEKIESCQYLIGANFIKAHLLKKIKSLQKSDVVQQ